MVLRIYCFIIIFFTGILFGQSEKCVQNSYFEQIKAINSDGLRCLATSSGKSNTIFLTYARWCGPCLYKIHTLFKLADEYDVELYVLMMDPENQRITYLGMEYVLEVNPNAKIVIIKDEGKKGKKRKYRDFLKKITPVNQDVIDDMGKWIVYDSEGSLKLITSYKDTEEETDKYDRAMVKRLIIPLLSKKTSL